MMSVNSKAKGKRGELLARDWLNANLVNDASRGQQYKGGKDSPDIESETLKQAGIHIEVKFDNKIFNKSVKKITNPGVYYNGTGYDPLVFIPEDCFFKFCKEAINGYYSIPELNKKICNTSLTKAMIQAETDSAELTPLLMIKGNRTKWVFIIKQCDVLNFTQAIKTLMT